DVVVHGRAISAKDGGFEIQYSREKLPAALSEWQRDWATTLAWAEGHGVGFQVLSVPPKDGDRIRVALGKLTESTVEVRSPDDKVVSGATVSILRMFVGDKHEAVNLPGELVDRFTGRTDAGGTAGGRALSGDKTAILDISCTQFGAQTYGTRLRAGAKLTAKLLPVGSIKGTLVCDERAALPGCELELRATVRDEASHQMTGLGHARVVSDGHGR